MAKKNNIDAIVVMAGAFCAVCGAPFALVSYFAYRHLAKKYDIANREAVIRVSDQTGSLLQGWFVQILLVGVFIALSAFCVFRASMIGMQRSYMGVIIFGLAALLCLGMAIPFSLAMAPKQIGMLVLPDKGIFVIPADSSRNTFSENLFQGKFFSDMAKMEELPIKDIQKVTRDKGTEVFVHGKFGTRRVSWGDKQKRDEAIATLERARGKRLTGIDSGY